MQRIKVVGTTGAGKSTLAHTLSQMCQIPHIQLDTLSWEPNWTPVPNDIYRQRVEKASEAPSWVMDGNHSGVYDRVWQRIDTVIWLDYDFAVILVRQLRRAKRRLIDREVCCNGNYESFQRFFSRDSIMLWALKTYHRRRRQYSEMFGRPEFSNITVLHFRSPRETEQWLQSISDKCDHT